MTVARQQSAKMWELRAVLSLARFSRNQGKPANAYELLALVYNWFTEGFGTSDLKHARELLEQCSNLHRAS
jgi:predicted ATPase